ncbi:SPFH domain-containing protein [Streptomyces triticisoli]|jgi:regulator of protease activity HflC (stomatin/prohibitin superfamily)|uniref:SPFH domain-containing protein n=1 Tax=Streptomyces triticisoli TaxID=2182797 RepID=UPI0018E5302E|nr:SPFH domain-containing protein [Streptomyces triticisoli]
MNPGLLTEEVGPVANLGAAIVRQHQRGVAFRFGKLRGVRDPGIRFTIPPADRMWKVTLRTVTLPIPSQQVITRDDVSPGVAAVACFRRVDPVKSLVEIEDVSTAIGRIARTTVRNVVGRSLLDQVLTDTETLNTRIKEVLDGLTRQWGGYVLLVELKDIELPAAVQRAVSCQAEAEREKRARVIAAAGETLSADRLAEAADVISDHPIALQLRNLRILAEIAAEKNSTIVFPAQFLESARTLPGFVEGEDGKVTAAVPDLGPRRQPVASGGPVKR